MKRLIFLAVLSVLFIVPSVSEARHRHRHAVANAAHGVRHTVKAVIHRATHPFGGRLRGCH
jgi:hypothetical protein